MKSSLIPALVLSSARACASWCSGAPVPVLSPLPHPNHRLPAPRPAPRFGPRPAAAPRNVGKRAAAVQGAGRGRRDSRCHSHGKQEKEMEQDERGPDEEEDGKLGKWGETVSRPLPAHACWTRAARACVPGGGGGRRGGCGARRDGEGSRSGAGCAGRRGGGSQRHRHRQLAGYFISRCKKMPASR